MKIRRFLLIMIPFLLTDCTAVGYSSAWLLYGLTSNDEHPRKIIFSDEIRESEKLSIVGKSIESTRSIFFIRNYPHYFDSPKSIRKNYLYMFNDSIEYLADILPGTNDFCLDSLLEPTSCIERYYSRHSQFIVVDQFQVKYSDRSKRDFIILEDSSGVKAEFDYDEFWGAFTVLPAN